ncbi:ferrochelatase [Marinimicrobium sp. ABcell2]|uniref:ferrochelatase n=1 Tax=Marinimicrobium sp. ABcell2 TaxID=3069751 RepID=UPI0027B65BBA|nr:ferrochelatase [Marinimicrobium sp. ABcell2]MDQ2076004.1 ferrochelatase [Marinimicrobium sp. ABcell2]
MTPRYSAINDNIEERFHQPSDSARALQQKTGVLLTNLGTPDAPTPKALRRYLSEFLSDPRVIELPRLLWLVILHGVILRIRPRKSAAAYQTVWTDEGSPLLVISQRQCKAVQEALGENAVVKLGMRYGNPSIASALREFQALGIRRIVVLPLYPQYSAATTGSTFDAVAKELSQWRWVPELRFINGYVENPLFIEALAKTLQEHINNHGMPDRFLFSYHGTPKRYLTAGDPYHCLCHKTTRLVREKLGLPEDLCMTTFQSRFGREEWLKPYTDHTLESLPKEGVKNVAILSPAFSADCLETLEELEVENRACFMEAGGEAYHYILALNDRPDHIEAIADILRRHGV